MGDRNSVINFVYYFTLYEITFLHKSFYEEVDIQAFFLGHTYENENEVQNTIENKIDIIYPGYYEEYKEIAYGNLCKYSDRRDGKGHRWVLQGTFGRQFLALESLNFI